eukprot:COSAG03_NODE_19572_length_334_cov_0.659574_1_plen_90_part_01
MLRAGLLIRTSVRIPGAPRSRGGGRQDRIYSSPGHRVYNVVYARWQQTLASVPRARSSAAPAAAGLLARSPPAVKKSGQTVMSHQPGFVV